MSHHRHKPAPANTITIVGQIPIIRIIGRGESVLDSGHPSSPPAPFQLRKAQNADIPRLMHLQREQVREGRFIDVSGGDADADEAIAGLDADVDDWARAFAGTCSGIVAVTKDEIIGMVLTALRKVIGCRRPVTVVTDLYVVPHYRRHGIATTLVKRIIETAATDVALLVMPDNPGAIAFYASVGLHQKPVIVFTFGTPCQPMI